MMRSCLTTKSTKSTKNVGTEQCSVRTQFSGQVILLLLFLLLTIKANGIDLLFPCSAAMTASSGLILTLDSPSGSYNNPAYLHNGIEAGITYLYRFHELPVYTFHISRLIDDIGLYGGIVHLDNDLYRETVVNSALSYHLSNISFGVSVRYLNSRAEQYHNKSRLLGDIGFLWSMSKVTGGFSLKNLTGSKLSGDDLPVVYLSELNYLLSDDISISIGAEKEKNYDFSYKVATSYKLYDVLTLAASYQNEPVRIGAGFIIRVRGVNISYGLHTHHYLDSTHFFSVGYALSP